MLLSNAVFAAVILIFGAAIWVPSEFQTRLFYTGILACVVLGIITIAEHEEAEEKKKVKK